MYRCELHNAKCLKIQMQDSVKTVKGDFYNNEFHPFPENLARNGIDEKHFYEYIQNNPTCTNVRIAK